MALALALSACAGGPGPGRQPPAAATSPKAKSSKTIPTAPAPAGHLPPAPQLKIAVLGPGDYRAGRKQRKDALLNHARVAALSASDVGYYMEIQEAELRKTLSGETKVRIAHHDSAIVIGPIGNAFASGSAALSNDLRVMLRTIVPVFVEYGKTLITVHAYTDATGSTRYNRKLSVRRALAVARYLVLKGVRAGRMIVVGHGESNPIASNDTVKGRAGNRRITIELTPLAR